MKLIAEYQGSPIDFSDYKCISNKEIIVELHCNFVEADKTCKDQVLAFQIIEESNLRNCR
jgi:hypothetical protein